MAVSKTPRKKPAAAVAEEKPAPKAKTAAKLAVTKKAEAEAPKAVAPAKAAAKPKAPKAAKTPAPEKVEEATMAPGAPAPVAEPSVEPMVGLPALAQTLLTAIQEGRAVEFIFADTDANAPRTFEPRQLTFDCLSRAWYVWGWDRRYNAERHHRVDLLAEVNAVEGVGRAAQGPYADGTPANQIGGWLGGEPIGVKATLLKQWVFAVKQAPPAFPNFKLEEQAEGQALVSFTATDLRAIARWAMQFGDGIQVLEPARLADRIKQVGAAWAGRERQAAPAPAAKAPRAEPTPEPRRHESRSHESRPHEPRTPRQEREARPEREREEAPKGKPGKVEVIRFDRL